MYIDSPNISGSLNITGSILLNGTAVTASGGGGGSGAGFPFSGSAVITGSLFVSGGNLSGSLYSYILLSIYVSHRCEFPLSSIKHIFICCFPPPHSW